MDERVAVARLRCFTMQAARSAFLTDVGFETGVTEAAYKNAIYSVTESFAALRAEYEPEEALWNTVSPDRNELLYWLR